MTVTAGNTLECFFKSCYQNPQTDFFRVWTSFMCVDKDLWQLQLFLPNTTVTRCNTLACFFKNCYQNPETDFFWVWTSFMSADLLNTTVTKCYILGWIFKSCLIKIQKLTSLEYEPVLWLLIKIFCKLAGLLGLYITICNFTYIFVRWNMHVS